MCVYVCLCAFPSMSGIWVCMARHYPEFCHRTFVRITLHEGLVTHESLLSPFLPAHNDLQDVNSSSSSISICFHTSEAAVQYKPDMTDQWRIKVKKLDPTVHSIMHLTSPDTISINSVKTHFYLARKILFTRCDMYLCSKWTTLSASRSLKRRRRKDRDGGFHL